MEINKDTKEGNKESRTLCKDGSLGQCNFFLKRKGRLCRFRPKLGQHYCPEHACVMGVETERKRIPCPLNPKHNCYEDEVQKHIKKCNVTKIQQKVEKEVYHVKGVNRGSSSSQESSSSKSQTSVRNLTSGNLAKMIEKVDVIYKAHVEPIESTHFQHSCVQDEICPSRQENISTALKNQVALRKELLQQAALIGQMEREKLLDQDNTCFVELGAGKGKLSHWIRKACHQHSKSKFLLVERGSVRYKVDGHQKQNDGEDNFKRIKMDIEDLYLGKVPGLESAGAITVVGKHLCGGATDMGIRCAVNTLLFDQQKTLAEIKETSHTFTKDEPRLTDSPNCDNPTTVIPEHSDATQPQLPEHKHVLPEIEQDLVPDIRKNENSLNSRLITPEEPPLKVQKIREKSQESSRLPEGIMIALCCHHRCTWDTYVGKSFMELCGLGPEEFDLLTRISSWATCARVRARSIAKPSPGLEVHASDPNTDDQSSTSNNLVSSVQGDAKEEHISEDLISVEKSSSQSLREQLSVSERERIGRQCKRIIDTGRLHFLRGKGMKASLREYIDEDTTPENVVLVAHV